MIAARSRLYDHRSDRAKSPMKKRVTAWLVSSGLENAGQVEIASPEQSGHAHSRETLHPLPHLRMALSSDRIPGRGKEGEPTLLLPSPLLTMKGYVIERNITLAELPGTLREVAAPVPTGAEVLIDVQ